MAIRTKVPRPVRKPDGWWSPRCPPHWLQALGPYESRAGAEADREGLEWTVNSPAWRSHMMDLEDEVAREIAES